MKNKAEISTGTPNPCMWHSDKRENPPDTTRFQNNIRQADSADAGTGRGRGVSHWTVAKITECYTNCITN